ncbi:MAG TPA: aspartate--tRNA ligase [Chloroflexota bacterium]|nr:aspartate--tRNA ligase [Chloroflexota bacterium]
MLKTHSCGQLRLEHINQTVTLAGWVNRRRDMGGVIFIDLRDRLGKCQVVIDAGRTADGFKLAEQVRSEYVLQIKGTVSPRPAGQENPNLPTGAIEVLAEEVIILNPAKTPPFLIDRDENVDESLRLKYRYLDLRRERLQRNLTIRHKAIKFIRDFMDEHGFLEVETPILFKSTPEGARDYLVPSRVHPGKFYALPQSPQQLKQLLMVAGYERYFQIARCFRDEDLRADRQPEFTQLDMEMSFVSRDDVLDLIEALMIGMVKHTSLVPLAYEKFPRLSYHEAMSRFGTDRPDVRYGLELTDISDLVAGSAFRVFAENVAAGKPVKAICAPGCGDYSRKQLTDLEELAKSAGAKALAWLAIHPETGELWASNSGRDLMGDDLPPETIYIVRDGLHYGWPTCHSGDVIDPDMGSPDSCEGVEPPVAEMQAHMAPLGIAFYTGSAFPAEYQGDLFIAQHGSWNRRSPVGYAVMRLPLDGSTPTGPAEDFITGWLKEDGTADGRPVGLAVGPDGALYISDDKAGLIYRVTARP